ncbi:probable cytochrome P450 12a5, mitochondrial [Sabethes cyaneus]|uniref:probable cytochrome P450 12a5, mitochondrial n=1 Tax=Sabethes cyaneus TaxID=53552 RepID=UPI00237E9C79|nr:probable cytochrome P450 12a5, mitochondrial [Sabethes cyaneus]
MPRDSQMQTTGVAQQCSIGSRISTVRPWSAQPPPTSETREGKEWANALPFERIPGPNIFKMVVNFAPGGRYYKANLPDLHRLLRKDYGDLLRMPGLFGRKDILLSFSPDDFEKIFRSEGQWPFRPTLDSFLYYRKEVRPVVFMGMGGLTMDQGESWQRFRTMVNPVMMQPKTVKLYIDKVDGIAREFMEIMKNIRDEKNELPADFDQWLNRWALETIGILAMDTRLGVLQRTPSDEAEHIVKNVRRFFELTYQLDFLPSTWRYIKTRKFKELMNILDELNELVKSKVDEAVFRFHQNPSLESHHKSVLEKLLSHNRFVAVLMAFDMLLAGVDTTTSGTTGILYCLARNPEKQEKLRQELRTILPKKDSPLTPENMRNMPYLRACIKEGLRLCPPITGTARGVGRNIVLQGYQIPKGTNVAMAAMTLLQEDKYYERAKEFLPERWLNQESVVSSTRKNSHPFVYIPFGFGPRACVGKRMAMMEMEIILARITRLFEYRWNYGELRIRGAVVNIPENELKFEMREVDD